MEVLGCFPGRTRQASFAVGNPGGRRLEEQSSALCQSRLSYSNKAQRTWVVVERRVNLEGREEAPPNVNFAVSLTMSWEVRETTFE